MSGGIITECPECETRFNVSEGQLKLADGKVRCGACLRVFDARAHQPYSDTLYPQAETGSSSGSNAKEQPAPQEYSLHVRYAETPRAASTAAQTQRPAEPANLLDDPDAPLEVYTPAEAPQQQSHSDWHRTAPEKPSAPIPIASFLRTPAQDAPSEELPDNLAEQSAEQTPEQTAAEQPDAPSLYIPQTVAEPASEPVAVEAPVHDQDGPSENVTGPKHEPESEPEPVIEVLATATEADSAPAHAQASPPAAPAQIEPQPEPPTAPQPHSTPQPQGLAALQDLHAEPLELTHPVTPAAPGAVLGWSLGCLAAAVLLASQLAWFNRIEWSREPLLADAYDILCHQLECAIPPYQAVELIHNRQLVVRAHPRYEDALSIDLLLENTASFRQPFPAIELSFSDIRGRTVARRVLQPQDYLDDILDPLKMPNSQPFQVNLAILDPGRRAVSYEVQLAPAQL